MNGRRRDKKKNRCRCEGKIAKGGISGLPELCIFRLKFNKILEILLAPILFGF